MTVTVVATTTTKTKRREPLGTIAMAAPKTQSRSANASSGTGKVKERRTTRLSASKQELEESTNKLGKRPAVAYEEDAEGFQFSLLPSKKPRPSIEAVPENPRSDVENAPPKSTPKRGRPRKKQRDDETPSSAVPAKGKSVELPSRRPTRGPAQTTHTEPESQPTNTIRSSRARNSPEHQPETKKPKKAGRPPKAKQQVQVSESNGYNSPAQPPEGTKVALPVADTPVIQRNKEFRGGKGDKSDKGRRRSSLTLPHREVGTADFYKHIADDGIPEPRRMRQLLIWCATRAIGEKPSGGSNSDDQSARLAARVIQEELLQDFSSNSELSNWLGREDLNPPAVVVKKPNPRNVQNTEKIKELEEHIQKLHKERQSLNALLRQPAIPNVKAKPQSDNQQKDKQPSRKSQREEIDPSLLDPSQQAILESLNPSSQPEGESSTPSSTRPPITPSAVSAQLSRITSGLAPTLDAFAAGVHDIELYRASADNVSSRILRICSQRLEERDTQNTQRRLAMEGNDDKHPPPTRIKEDLGLILGALSRVERR
ncbi:Mtw1 kinetochore complex, DSN1 [Penicillium expansum]|uniref:Mtw1 kinetochore complex, DSN1 n=1 Tax=Penicillium expansum TaxID=27334 RepID=A0A0A2JSN6_PENEN|nr:Mtw1 kinetochore complex, DSN1 [Penicillium expansum]KGO56039.1 Mtw1 kinetochore complex, DSN1 [Penicillium expansum]KGO58429.1 Mtw1 kinetochore complex, DSN1 [Penicillium expansum]